MKKINRNLILLAIVSTILQTVSNGAAALVAEFTEPRLFDNHLETVVQTAVDINSSKIVVGVEDFKTFLQQDRFADLNLNGVEVMFDRMMWNATPEQILDAGEELSAESIDKITSVYFYWKSATHPDATPYDIRLAAECLAELDESYYKNAAALLVRSADHPDAHPETTKEALEGLLLCEEVDVSSDFTLSDAKYKSEWMYIANKLLNHPNSTDDHKKNAEEFLHKLGQYGK